MRSDFIEHFQTHAEDILSIIDLNECEMKLLNCECSIYLPAVSGTIIFNCLFIRYFTRRDDSRVGTFNSSTHYHLHNHGH